MTYFWKKKTIVYFVLSLLVVFRHTYAINHYNLLAGGTDFWNNFGIFFDRLFRMTLANAAAPLFFILSGAIFFRNYKKGMYKEKIVPRVYSLFIPYLLWNTIWTLFDIICSYTPLSNYFFDREKFVISIPNIIESVIFYKSNWVFWFIYCLIVFVLLTPFFDFLTSKKWSAAILLIIAFIVASFFPEAYSIIKVNAGAVFYYCVGVTLGKYHMGNFVAQNTKMAIPATVGCATCIGFQMLGLYGIIDIPTYLEITVLTLLSLSFWRSMDMVCDKIKEKDYMNKSFFIYATHANVIACIAALVYYVCPKEAWMSVPCFIISYISTVVVIVSIANVMEKKVPKVYSLLSGSR